MGDFFVSPGGFPEPPEEPDTPAPDFGAAGLTFGVGLGESGMLNGIWKGFLEACAAVLTWGIGWLLRIAITVLTWAVNLLTAVENEASTAYGPLVAATVKNLLGVSIDPSTVATRAGSPARSAAAQAMGQALVRALFGAAPVAGGNGLPPSDSAVKQFLGTAMNIELNGWLESWFADAATYHLLSKYGDLKDGIVRVMGIGRMSRTAMAPLVKTFLHDPYLSLLQRTYRTKPIAEATALQAFLRAQIDREELSQILAPQGYTEQDIEWLFIQHTRYIPDADVDYLLSRGIWSNQQALDYLALQGWGAASGQHLLDVMEDRRLQKYRVEAVNVAQDAYVRGEMDQSSFEALVGSSGLTEVEQSWIKSVGNLKRQTHVTHLTQGEIQQGILDGILNLNDLKKWALRVNMPADEEAFLELLTLFKQNKESASTVAKAAAAKAKAAAAQAKLDAAAAKALEAKAQAADRGLTIAQAEALVQSGDWTFDRLTAFLTTRGYGSDAIDGIVKVLHHQIAKATAAGAAAGAIRTTAAAKGLNLNQTEKAVLDGILTMEELKAFLVGGGFNAHDTQVILDLSQHALDDQATRAAAKAAAAAAKGKHGISLQALEHAARIGITPVATYTAALRQAGFDAASVDLLTATLAAQIASDKAKAPSAGKTTSGPSAKALTLAQLEQEIISGIRPVADYTAELAALGYDAGDQKQLTQLLQLKVNHAAKAAALHSDANGKAVATGISLAALENSILDGINQFASYDKVLKQLGYDAVDRKTLEALLQEKIAAKVAKQAPAG